MDNIPKNSVLRQCLSLLPFEAFSSVFLDYGVKKLTSANLFRIAVGAQLANWASYSEIEEQIRAMADSQELFGLTTISGSQLSRRINDLPTTYPQRLFFAGVHKLRELTVSQKRTSTLGQLNLVDSSSLRLAPNMGKWAYVKHDNNSVKFHTRFVLAAPDIGYPDLVIPSTGNFDDRELALELVTDPNAIHVMDRGFVDYIKMDQWVRDNILFAMRINERHTATVLEGYDIPPDNNRVHLDAKVILGKAKRMKHPLRLVEFTDDTGRKYRIATNAWDMSAQDIMEVYRSRWMIELFFKWLKQHLRLVKLQSTKPQGIWNQIFFAMIAYCLVLYVRLTEQSAKSVWDVLKLVRIYIKHAWETFWYALHRQPGRPSKGRQKPGKPAAPLQLDGAGVAKVKAVGEMRRKTAKYFQK